jgi:hypothetical protein
MKTERVPFDPEDFWDDLLALVEDGRVIPVVGRELLTIQDDRGTVPLYRAVAERLLAKYQRSDAAPPQSVVLRDGHELHDAVSALVADGKRVKDLYRPINDILQNLLANQVEPAPALKELAAIRHFDLFVTTTPDDLLARAIDTVRFGGAAQTDEIAYAPALPTSRRRDIPELRSSNYAAVFYMFGKRDASPLYTIHDEDALEFAYTLQYTHQNGVPPVRMFDEVRSRHLLLIGCNFADWLGRFFLRLSNEKRLSSDDRQKSEFLVDRATPDNKDLTVFLQRFSRDSRCYPMGAAEFVSELHRRWVARNPPSTPGREPPDLLVRTSSSVNGGIFISYASQDIAAAKTVFAELREYADVVWLDKSALKPGDDWNQQIKSAVRQCEIFLPLISATTERRTEGYFRLEWHEAAERTKKMQGRKFIFPIVIDADFSGDTGTYRLVPDAFTPWHYTHGPGGQLPRELRDEIEQHLRSAARRTG